MARPNAAPGLRRIIAREVRQIRSRPALAFMLAPMPLLIFLMLGAVFASGLPRDLPVAVVDLDGSPLSRQIVRMVDASSDVAVSRQVPTLTEARQALLRREVYGILLVPAGLEQDLQLGARPEIVIFSNSQFLTAGGIAARSMATSALTFSAGVSVRTMQAKGMGLDQVMDLVTPIPVQQSPLFNPSLDYIQFLLSSVIPTVMQIFICAAAVLAFSRERHSANGLPRLMRLSGTPAKAIAGKLIPYTVLGTLGLMAGDLILFSYFDVSFPGNVPIFLLNGLIFVLACQALGALIALIARDTTGALGMMGLIVAPAFGFAGVSFPRFGMTTFAQVWGALIPLTPYLQLRTDQTLRGAPIAYALPAMGWLTALFAVFALLLWLKARRMMTPPRAAEPGTAQASKVTS